MTDILFFDTETTGLPEKGKTYETDFLTFPRIVQIAWELNGVCRDFIIRPDGYEIPESSTKIHGITTEKALAEGYPISAVIMEFIIDCYCAKKIVAHNIYFDTSIIKSEVLRYQYANFTKLAWDALDKDKRVDTMRSSMKFVGAKQPNGGAKFPSLVELYQKLFNDTFTAHNAKDDVKALRLCFEELVKQNIISL